MAFDIFADDGSRDIDRSKVHAEINRILNKYSPASAREKLVELSDEVASQMYDWGYSDGASGNL